MMQGSFNISIKQFETSLLGYGEEGVAFWEKSLLNQNHNYWI